MTVITGNTTTLVIGGTDISTYVNKITPKFKMEAKKFAGMGGADVIQIPGAPDAEWDVEGAFDPTVDNLFGPWVLEKPQVGRTTTINDPGQAGFSQYSGTMVCTDYQPDFVADELKTFKATLALYSGNISRG